MVVVDNNILSSLAKAKNLKLLFLFFDQVETTPGVIEELRDEKIQGYEFVGRIHEIKTFEETTEKRWLSVLSLTREENKKKEEILDLEQSLGATDVECLVVAEKRDKILLTDDTYLGREAKSRNIEAYDLESFLEASVRIGIIDNASDLKELLEKIEEKDYYSFAAGFKNQLFSILEGS